MAKSVNPQLPLTPSFTLEQTMKIKTVKKKSGSTITVGFTVTWPNELAPLPPNHKEHWLREAAGNPKVIEKLKEWKVSWRCESKAVVFSLPFWGNNLDSSKLLQRLVLAQSI